MVEDGAEAHPVSWLRIAKNATANILRGGAAALVALLLPPFLTRLMPRDEYGAWVFVLQLSAYVSYFEFGVATAVGRYIAHARELADADRQGQVLSTACAILAAGGLLAGGLVSLLSWRLPVWFAQLPSDVSGSAQGALWLVGMSAAVCLPASAFQGVFVGLQRCEIPALIGGTSRVLTAIVVLGAAWCGLGIVVMASATAALNLLAAFAQVIVARRFAGDIRCHATGVTRSMLGELTGYCLSLSVWSFGLLLVTGLDTTLVGLFDFPAVSYYAIAATLVACLLGLQNAVVRTLIPVTAALHARRDAAGLGRLLIASTRHCAALTLLAGVPLILGARPIFACWVPADYAEPAAVLFQVLVAANMVSTLFAPYTVFLIGTGQQRLVLLTPLAEGITNVAVSIAAGRAFGAVGVAWGTMAGAAVSVAGHLWHNMPRAAEIAVSRREFVSRGLLPPLSALAAPALLGLAGGALGWDGAPGFWGLQSLALAAALSVTALTEDERRRLCGWLAERIAAMASFNPRAWLHVSRRREWGA